MLGLRMLWASGCLAAGMLILGRSAGAAFVSAQGEFGEIPGPVDSRQSSTAPYDLTAHISDSVFDGSTATATAHVAATPAGFAGLGAKVIASARATGAAGDLIGSRASANARWEDHIWWVNPPSLEELLTLRFIFTPTVRGTLQGPHSEGFVEFSIGGDVYQDGKLGGGTFNAKSKRLQTGFDLAMVGTSVFMDITVRGGADPFEGPSTSDFSHTAWLPAIEMVDLAGNHVPGGENAILMGESGIRYAMWSPSLTYAADFDEDLDVDADDLDLWRVGVGVTSGASHVDGDANYDGAVDGADFLVWQQQAGSGASATAVPEPVSGLLLVVVAASHLSCTRAHRRRAT